MKIHLLTEDEVKNEIVRIARDHLKGGVKIYLFGSRADGTFKETSDYDICLDAGKKISGNVMQKIREELDHLNIMSNIDVSDYYTLNPDFQKQINTGGILLDES